MTRYICRACIAVALLTTPGVSATTAFINEFHYDNSGADLNEGIEIAAIAGTDLDGMHLILYNGSNGMGYQDIALSGIVPDQQAGFGTLFFALSGIQNGPDGMALVSGSGTVIEFLSYEGSFFATDGAAAGMESVDVGVFEDPGSDPTRSLQLTGSGSNAAAFIWMAATSSPGLVNVAQNFVAPVPIPGAGALIVSALAGLLACRKSPVADGYRCGLAPG